MLRFRDTITGNKLLLGGSLMLLPLFIYLIWTATDSPVTLSTLTKTYQEAGTQVKQDFETIPSLPLTEEDAQYTITDTTSDGIGITFANQSEQALAEEQKPKLSLSFPKNYSEPITLKLDDQRTIEITDLGGKSDYEIDTLSQEQTESPNPNQPEQGFFQKLFSQKEKTTVPPSYLRYTSKDQRKELLYAYQKDQASGEKKLKHWTLYQKGDGIEQESYQFKNAKLRINDQGIAEVYYYGDQDLKNDQAVSEVDSNLLERAQRTLAKEMGEDIMNGTSGKTPDFTIPQPYYLDNQGTKHEAEWKYNEETSTLSVSFTPEQGMYPVALDPTLAFTAPGVSNGGSVITGEAGSSFGYSMVTGDFNADGKTDLAVGAFAEISYTGRVYIFYNDGTYPTSGADVVITGETNTQFGAYIGAGDFNADGRTDLVTGAVPYSSQTGRAYIFYNDGAYPVAAVSADVIIIGEATNNYFGVAFTAGDFNADGRTDLAVASSGYSTNKGRLYIFYNDGSYPATAASADVIITGNASNDYFGTGLSAGDFNADGRTDLVVSSPYYSSSTGRAYIFYGDGSIPTTAATADVIITGNATSDEFGIALTAADLNADGKVDLAIAAPSYSSSTGRAYIFYNDGSIPTTAATADVTITGETTSNQFGYALTSGDFNADGRTDLAVGAYYIGSGTGRAYIFYNDASIPTTAATADVVIIGEAGNYGSYFGRSLVSGDFNADGRIDLVVAADYYNSSAGRVYFFYSQNGQVNTNQSITGNASGDNFGGTLATGDWNADGRTDLAVGANGYSTGTGRVYVFYGDGQVPSTATTADVTLTGEATSDSFGYAIVSGDFNVDGKTDLAVGAPGYAANDLGRTYVFYNGSIITENASGADIIITGANGYTGLGASAVVGDFNADGKTDLAVHGNYFEGYVYIFYGGSIITETTSGADVAINGAVSAESFGVKMTTGDFNADGQTDLAVLASAYSTNTGRVYVFYGGSIITESASGADVTITGDTTSRNMYVLASGDLNADGRTDLVLGAYGTPGDSYNGHVYIFYNGAITTEVITGADVIITGSAGTSFGQAIVVGDFNADGRTDLASGGPYYSSNNTGRVYIFYNDGSYPENADSADVTITGEATSNYFGYTLVAGDMNSDGRIDLIVGAYGNTSSTGKVYFYETRENFAWQIQRQPQPGSGPLRVGTNTTGQELKITGEAGSGFGATMTTGDLNSDGKADLIVGATTYATNTGRVYVFYSDGSLATGATNADVVITGEANSSFGGSITGDFNADGRVDLAVGAYSYGSATGRVYIFYNDGSIPTTAATADVTIFGETNSYFGVSLVSGDFNADGTADLAVGGDYYSANYTGRVYVFYNDGSFPTAAGSADVIITGESTLNQFGSGLTTGDLNADGKTDLVVGAWYLGKVYIFYGGSIVTENASGADVIIVGTRYFGWSLVAGDFNADGRTDLAVSDTEAAGSAAGKVRLFYNDGSIPTTTGTADVTITEASSSQLFGSSLAAGDFNADGRTDLVAGAYGYSSYTGRAFVFYNDGAYPSAPSSADVILTGGEATSSYFGASLVSGDFNADGRTDLAVGASVYSSTTGRVYVYTLGNDPVITGQATTNNFGYSIVAGDFNADGRTDLAVGAFGYSSLTGRVYIFYSDGSYPSLATSADVTISGTTASDWFGFELAAGDVSADGKTDLLVGSNVGKLYVFYNDGSYTSAAATADVLISGSSVGSPAITVGDVNTDGKMDIVSTAFAYSSAGRAYIFYGDGTNNFGSVACTGSAPAACSSSNADIIIDGTGTKRLARAVTGDMNSDGRSDLILSGTNGSAGEVYVLYNDGTSLGTVVCTTACSVANADITITGENSGDGMGDGLAVGDVNADGKDDIVAGAPGYSTNTGRAYVFYGDGSIPTTAVTADVTITGAATINYFGTTILTTDANSDGRTDVLVGAYGENSGMGRAHIFYNDGAYPSVTTSADMTLSGSAASNYFSIDMTSADFNMDGKIDIAVGAYGYSTATGATYIFTSEAAPTGSLPAVTSLKGTGKFKGTGKLR